MNLPTEYPSLTLRTLAPSDAPEFFGAIDANREFLSVFESRMVAAYPDINTTRRRLASHGLSPRHDYGMFVEGQFAGNVSVMDRHEDVLICECSYWLQEQFTGNGYAAIALGALTRCLAYRYYWYKADVLPNNTASIKTLEAADFTYDRTTRAGYLHYALCADDVKL